MIVGYGAWIEIANRERYGLGGFRKALSLTNEKIRKWVIDIWLI